MNRDQLKAVSDALHNGAEPHEIWKLLPQPTEPPRTIRKRLTTILRKIIGAREERRPVIALWQEYTLTAQGMRLGHQCFNCNKAAEGIYYVQLPCGKGDEQLYFCSPQCEQDFRNLWRQA